MQNKIEIGIGKILILLIADLELMINQDMLVLIAWMHYLWHCIQFGIVILSNRLL